ncbi:MAG: restriction endonuclease subunit S [Maribacter arcticus]|uniref:restriction endonuclease subunit S n=1 Tax=Maribacter arcticus TaxID=561365 RepID=UPI003003A451
MQHIREHIATKKLFPQLRFKEFDGDIAQHLFENIFLFSTGKNIKQAEASPEFETPCVRYGELYHMYNEVIKDVINKTNLDTSELLFSKGDEILLPSAGEDPLDIGSASALTLKNVAIGRTINILRPQEENIYSQIFASYYINEKLRKKISTLARGASISNVYNSDLKKLKINLPSLPEQQKIASFLSSVDEKIQQLSKKKALLEQYKKGVMQQLFSGQLRFKDENGKDYPDWEEKRLLEFCTFFSGGTPSSTNKKFYSGTIPFIGSGNIYDSEVFNFISEEALNSSSAKIVEEGDLLYALYGANSGEVAISQLEGAINQAILCIRTKESIEYLYYVLLGNKDNIVAKYLQGGQGNLSAQIIKKLKYKFPSIEEQQKIASYLSGIDSKIENVNNQINQTQTFKKGLLQQMFV